ncbi:MAG: hypothetical protein IPN42_00920 [Methylococcaceae bacterium]|nr:hypothetical protein [Methylococcaceae bacterium]
MSIFTAKRSWIVAGFFVISVLAPPAYALFAKLSTDLIAAVTIGGVKPSGSANVNQSKYPSSPGVFSIKLSNVKLPDGSVLAVNISDCPWYGPVAYLKVFGGSATLSTTLPGNCQVGRLSSITVLYKTTLISKGGNPWKI